jgi:hypothetical protein
MKAKIPILTLFVVIAVVMISGCASSSTSKYDDEFISFDHPSSINVTGGPYAPSAESIKGTNEDNTKLYFIFEIQPVSSEYPTDLEEWKNLVITETGETPEATGNITIGGINGAYVISDSAWYYVTKGDTAYEFVFYRNNIQENEIHDIIKTIQLK